MIIQCNSKSIYENNSFEYESCPICECNKKVLVYKYKKNVKEFMCRRCGHIYLNGANNHNLDIQDNFRQSYPDNYLLNKYGIIFEIAKERKLLVDKTVHSLLSIMEIGCGCGHFLSLFGKEIFKVGIDPSKDESEFANQCFSIDEIWNCKYEDIPKNIDSWPDIGFDIVCSFHTIEHIINPIKFIRFIKSKVKESGFIFIAAPNVFTLTPNFIDFLFLYAGIHRHIFNPVSLSALLENNGFKILSYYNESKALSDSSFIIIAQNTHDYVKSNNFCTNEDYIDKIYKAIKKFHFQMDGIIDNITCFLKTTIMQNKKIAIYGGGIHTVALISNLSDEIIRKVICIIDDDPEKVGTKLKGIPIKRLKDVVNDLDIVLVSSWASESAILKKISTVQKIKAYGIYRDFKNRSSDE